jgi:hypothetical protein
MPSAPAPQLLDLIAGGRPGQHQGLVDGLGQLPQPRATRRDVADWRTVTHGAGPATQGQCHRLQHTRQSARPPAVTPPS